MLSLRIVGVWDLLAMFPEKDSFFQTLPQSEKDVFRLADPC